MKHRIFIASHLPDSLKKVLINYQQSKLSNSCFRIAPEQALHLTLIFIGDVSDNDLLKIIQACQSSISLFSPVEVKLDKITYLSRQKTDGPIPHYPRLVWAEGSASKELSQLHKTLEQELINKEVNFKLENRLFRPHITLARIKKDDNQNLPSLSEIEEKIEESFVINQISVIESELTPQGPKYTNLNTFEF